MKQKRLPFVAVYPSDFTGGISDLSTVELALYFKLCLRIWDSGKGVETCDLHRQLREPPEVLDEAIAALMRMEKISVVDGRYFNQRAFEEFEKAQRRRASGKAAAQTRWQNRDATVMRPHTERISQPEPDLEPEPEIKEETVRAQTRARGAAPPDHFHAQYDPAFKTFMKELQATYPEHVGRSNWRKAEEGVVALLNDGYTHDRIRGAVMRKRAFHEAKGDLGTEFVTNPGNFFADPENIDNLWRPPGQQQRKTRKEEAAEHNWQTLQALRRGADEAGGPGRLQQGDSGGGGVSRPQIASNGS